MTEIDQIDHVVNELRELAFTGADVPTLLRWIQSSLDLTDCKLLSVKCFHMAFGGGIAAISPIGGWSGFGGELSDAEVESLVSPVITGFRHLLERQTAKEAQAASNA